jgi:hypothetical protein
MPYTDKIVDHINDTLKAGTLNRRAFQTGVYYGLAKIVNTVDRDGNKSVTPFIYTSNGKKEIDPTIDDTFPFQIYHRCLNMSYKPGKNNFGDGNSSVVETSNMIAVVYGDPERLKLTQEDVAFLIVNGMPTNLTSTDAGNSNLGLITITVQAVNNNSQQVFTVEYGSGDYILKPQSIYFAINYQIETESDRGCLTCQDC